MVELETCNVKTFIHVLLQAFALEYKRFSALITKAFM